MKANILDGTGLEITTLVDLLRSRALEQPEEPVYGRLLDQLLDQMMDDLTFALLGQPASY